MSKDFRVTLKYDRLSKKYTVVQIVGNDVSITLRGLAPYGGVNRVVHAGSVLNEVEATRLGRFAELTTK